MKRSILLILFGVLLGNTLLGQGSGNALSYDATNGYVSVPIPTLFNNLAANDFTIETWFAVGSSSVSKRVIFAQFNTNNFATILVNPTNIPYVFITAGGLNYSANTNTPLAPGSWNHFAVTWDASAKIINCYINGVYVSHISGGGSSTGNDNTMTIGSRTDGGQIFKGALDNLRIWSDIRTECEIYGSMNTEFTVAQPNLIADYNFNAGVAGANNTGVNTLSELNNSFSGTLNGFLLNGTASNWVTSGATTYTQNSNDGTAYFIDNEVACETYTWINGTTYTNSVSGATYSYNSTAGCPVVSTLNLTINNLPVVTGGLDQIICEGDTITLSGSGASAYVWNNGISNDLAFVPSSTSSYIVNGTDGNGCSNADTVLVVVNSLPNVSAGSDQTVCEGNSVIFSGSGAVSYNWNNVIMDNVSFIATANATYVVEGTDANGCMNYDTAMLVVNALPAVNAGSDQVVCEGTDVTLTATGDPANYIWNNGVVDNVPFTPFSTADYIVTATDINGCSNADTVTVTLDPLPSTVITQTNLTLSVPVAGTYQWIDCDSGTEISGGNNQSFTVSNNGNYAVIVTSVTGCSDTSSCLLINDVGLGHITTANFKVYPNPAKDFFTISQLDPTEHAYVSLYDATGKIVFSESVNASIMTISTVNLESGIYFVRIYSEDVQYAPIRIVLN